MTYSAVIATVLGSAALAGFLAWLTRRIFRLDYLRRHHEIGSAVFLQLGVIYAVLLAFVFSEVWTEYNTAANAINQECASLHGASLLATALPADEGRPVQAALAAYLASVVQREWPDMREGRSSGVAGQAFSSLTVTVAATADRSGADAALRERILSQLAEAHQWRETRLFQMTLGVPHLLWGLLIGLGTVLVGFLLCFAIENVGSQVVFTAVFAGAMAFVLALVRCLDYPFEGSLGLGPGDFAATLQKVALLLNG